jgi:hypothetical protein
MAYSTVWSHDTLTAEPFALVMACHDAGLEIATARLLASEYSVTSAEVDQMLRPKQAGLLQASDERVALHDKLVARGLQANREGAIAKASDLFWEAWRLDQQRVSTLISHLNMRLKLGDFGVAAATYLRLLEDVVLTDRDWQAVQAKLQLANRLLVERKEQLRAVLRLQRTWRQAAARRSADARAREVAAARVLQRRVLRARPPPPFVEQVILLRLAPQAVAHATGSAVDTCAGGDELRGYAATQVLAFVTARRSDGSGSGGALEPRAVAPFAALGVPTAAAAAEGVGSAPLHFVVTSKNAEV